MTLSHQYRAGRRGLRDPVGEVVLHGGVLGVGVVVVHVVLGVVVLVDDLRFHGGPGVGRGVRNRSIVLLLKIVFSPVDPVLCGGRGGRGDGEDVVVRVEGVDVWK